MAAGWWLPVAAGGWLVAASCCWWLVAAGGGWWRLVAAGGGWWLEVGELLLVGQQLEATLAAPSLQKVGRLGPADLVDLQKATKPEASCGSSPEIAVSVQKLAVLD